MQFTPTNADVASSALKISANGAGTARHFQRTEDQTGTDTTEPSARQARWRNLSLIIPYRKSIIDHPQCVSRDNVISRSSPTFFARNHHPHQGKRAQTMVARTVSTMDQVGRLRCNRPPVLASGR